MPELEVFDGTKDPLDHLETYKALMHLQTIPDDIICRAFTTILKRSGIPQSINTIFYIYPYGATNISR
jgi:hypothetical protein